MNEQSIEKSAVMNLEDLDFKYSPSPDRSQQGQEIPATSLPPNTIPPIPTNPNPQVQEKPPFTPRMKIVGRFLIFLIGVGILFFGRYSVPEHDVACVEDKVLEVFEFANDFINKLGNESYRNAFQIVCSLFVDITFLLTMGYWVVKGNSFRLPLTLAVFYVIRALIQKIFFLPFTDGYWWNDPGFPSLVVPYGRGSDFFFSGHSGFLVICARELHLEKRYYSMTLAILTLIYTMLTLVVYRIHYSIDIFTGVFFADWCFIRMDQLKVYIDPLVIKIMTRLKEIVFKKKPVNQLQPQEQKVEGGVPTEENPEEKSNKSDQKSVEKGKNLGVPEQPQQAVQISVSY